LKGKPILPDSNHNNSGSHDSARNFDWGPPASSAGDGIKEWLVYLLIVALLCAVAWVLLDINGRKSQSAVDSNSQPVAGQILQEVKKYYEPEKASVSQIKTQFFVQLGAFADEGSATEVYEQMIAEGFSPTLAPPDENYELFRIFVGPFNSSSQAEEVAQSLNELEFHCFVIESL